MTEDIGHATFRDTSNAPVLITTDEKFLIQVRYGGKGNIF